MDTWGIVLLAAGALVIGAIAAVIDPDRSVVEAIAVTAGAFAGGFVASGQLGALSDWGTAWYGLQIFPALIGALVVAAVMTMIVQVFAPPTGPASHEPLPR